MSGRAGRDISGAGGTDRPQERRACHEKASVLRLALAIVLAGALGSAAAQDSADKASRRKNKPAPRRTARARQRRAAAAAGRRRHRTFHRHRRSGKLAYTATAGTLAFYDQSGEQSAAVFYTAYVAKDAGANRPLTFVFNGGPGAASAFLHLGLVGPRILDLGPDGRDAATAQLRDNPDTWLELHRPGADRSDRHRLEPHGQAGRRQAFLEHPQRRRSHSPRRSRSMSPRTTAPASPKYLFGESYGGFRAAKVARALQRDQGIVDLRHRDAVADAGRLAHFRRRRVGAARGAAIAVAGGGRTRAQECVQPGGAGGGGKIRHDRLSGDHGRRAAAGRGRQGVLRARGAD